LVVVRCFKNNLFFLPTFKDEGDTSSSIQEFYLRKCVLETPQIKKNTERALPKDDVKVRVVVFVGVSILVLLLLLLIKLVLFVLLSRV